MIVSPKSKVESKACLLAIEQILFTKKRVTANDIIRLLEKHYDIRVERKTVYSDIAVITRFYDVRKEKVDRQTYYFINRGGENR